MLTALLNDFRGLPGVEVATIFGRSLLAARTAPDGVLVHPVETNDEEAVFRSLAAAADWTLVVAPEFDDILANHLHWIAESGGRSLGPTPGAARLVGDKLRLADHLRQCSVATAPTVLWPTAAPSFPAMCKPRFGAGSQATFLVHNERELRQAVELARAEQWRGDLIVQSHVPGDAVSVAFLIGPGRRLPLPAAAQHLSKDGRFRYRGGSLPLAPEKAERATRLAARAVDAVEGLRGYVGVDLVLGPTADGDAAIEINPRPTTSYVGLRALARFNLAEAMLAVAAGQAPPAWEWRTGQVHFTADGRLHNQPEAPAPG